MLCNVCVYVYLVVIYVQIITPLYSWPLHSHPKRTIQPNHHIIIKNSMFKNLILVHPCLHKTLLLLLPLLLAFFFFYFHKHHYSPFSITVNAKFISSITEKSLSICLCKYFIRLIYTATDETKQNSKKKMNKKMTI